MTPSRPAPRFRSARRRVRPSPAIAEGPRRKPVRLERDRDVPGHALALAPRAARPPPRGAVPAQEPGPAADCALDPRAGSTSGASESQPGARHTHAELSARRVGALGGVHRPGHRQRIAPLGDAG
jgi:hypothetical protein